VAESSDLRLVPDEGFYGDPMSPDDQLPALGYGVADKTGRKLSWDETKRRGLLPFPLELDTPWDERLGNSRFDPGQLVSLVPDPSTLPVPRVRVWDASGSWRIGYLGISYSAGGDGRQLLSRWQKDNAFSGIVLVEGVWKGKRIHETILVGPPETIYALHRSLEM
jgi:hypothetical protein